jgi:hypothetical protein
MNDTTPALREAFRKLDAKIFSLEHTIGELEDSLHIREAQLNGLETILFHKDEALTHYMALAQALRGQVQDLEHYHGIKLTKRGAFVQGDGE